MQAQTDLAAAFEAHYAQAAGLLSRLRKRVDEIERGLQSQDAAILATAVVPRR